MREIKKTDKKIELLAPAGNFDALTGAIAAGADAIYLGGQRFSARAYAENFTEKEICEGIHTAHVFGKKVYLTVNTLLREGEIESLCDFLLPFYQCGLDGVIVQDLGALRVIRKNFPALSIHASTQMTLTGMEGIRLLQRAGVSRVVPARELSLDELVEIKRQTGMELEVFVHGAMCYCYSGQCLLSSILGGRSGNRGRCAQPCRLPYRINGGEAKYFLSMRDMCALSLLPELIDVGMDSLKIEGRMKKPAYTAGVTAIYRNYIDAYYEAPEQFHIEQKDILELQSLYIRSETSEGYYHKRNGRKLLTVESSAYSKTDEGKLSELEKKYIENRPRKKAVAEVSLRPGQRAELLLKAGDLSILEAGEVVQPALKQPLTREKVAEQIEKSGNTLISIQNTKVNMEETAFLPVRALNELRRRAVARLESLLIQEQGLTEYRDAPSPEKGQDAVIRATDFARERQIHVFVKDWQQFQAALSRKVARIYIDYHLILENERERLAGIMTGADCELFLSTPYVIRSHNTESIKKLKDALKMPAFQGVLIRNLEAAAYFEACKKQLVLDSALYMWNRWALEEIGELLQSAVGTVEFSLPVECNIREWEEIARQGRKRGMVPSAQVYGRLPMMVTANCVRKTIENCTKKDGWMKLTDRYQKDFPVYTDCTCCYNVIYNSVPLSLHQMVRQKKLPEGNYRLDFTTESGQEAEKVIRYFQEGCQEAPFYQEYTTGHYKRGAE